MKRCIKNATQNQPRPQRCVGDEVDSKYYRHIVKILKKLKDHVPLKIKPRNFLCLLKTRNNGAYYRILSFYFGHETINERSFYSSVF